MVLRLPVLKASKDLDLIRKAAEAAGKIALGYFTAEVRAWEKDGGAGPVTEADLAVDSFLRDTLTDARPGFGWLSEETEDGSERLSRSDVFIVDPIDGTRSFIEGSKTWAISIAVACDGVVMAGVVHLPARGLTYAAELGGGAMCNRSPVRTSPAKELETARVLSAKSNFKPDYWHNVPPRPELHFRSSLAYRMACVAEGRFDAMLTLRPTWEWDVAAGSLLVTEAGGSVATTTGMPRFNNASPLLDGIVAGAPNLVASYLEHGPRLPGA